MSGPAGTAAAARWAIGLLVALAAAVQAAAEPEGVWEPTVGLTWEIRLSSPPESFAEVDAYDVDLFETPETTIAAMHARNIRVICYFSAGSFEAWREDAGALKPFRGRKLRGWPGEWWLDIRRPEVRQVMAIRLDFARDKGCDAVDPDNVDGYANRNGLGLTEADQLAYLAFLAQEAHDRGLAIGLKNAVELVSRPGVVEMFEFTVNEECFDYRECDALRPFVAAGKPVLQIQYGNTKHANRWCPDANSRSFSTLVKRHDLGGWSIACWSR
jgi:hypothetical protein